MITRKTRYGIALMSALALLSFWAARDPAQAPEINPAGIDVQLDYALKNFELQYFDEKGNPALKMVSPSFTSESATGEGLVTTPVVEVRYKGQVWNIIADSATITDAQDYVYLRGEVLLERQRGKDIPWMQINAYDVDWEIAPRIGSSEMQLDMQDESGHLSATGFTIDMVNNNFELHKDVKGVYVLP